MMANKGFTLIEMMITVAIAALLLTLAAPGFESFIINNRLAAQTNTFVTALHLARTEAIARNRAVVICQSSDGQKCADNDKGYEQGWIIFVDENGSGERDDKSEPPEPLIRVNQGMPQGMSLIDENDKKSIVYNTKGTFSLNYATTLHLCQEKNKNGRRIYINSPGRARVETVVDCPTN